MNGPRRGRPRHDQSVLLELGPESDPARPFGAQDKRRVSAVLEGPAVTRLSSAYPLTSDRRVRSCLTRHGQRGVKSAEFAPVGRVVSVSLDAALDAGPESVLKIGPSSQLRA